VSLMSLSFFMWFYPLSGGVSHMVLVDFSSSSVRCKVASVFKCF
jgi:hypothetical protein